MTVHFTMGGGREGYNNYDNRPDMVTIRANQSSVSVEVATTSQADGDMPSITLTIDANSMYTVGDSPNNTASVKVVEVPGNNPPTGKASISGVLRVGETVRADTTDIMDPDGHSSGIFGYIWQRADDSRGTNFVVIRGEDSVTYTLQPADAGKRIRVSVNFVDDLGKTEGAISDWTAAVAFAMPEVTVAAATSSVVGGGNAVFTLTRTGGDLTSTLTVTINVTGSGVSGVPALPTSAIFQINSVTAEVSVLTSSVAAGAASQMVTLAIQASSGNTYTVGSSPGDSATVTVEPMVSDGAPEITGTAKVGEELTAAEGTIDDSDGLGTPMYTYQWQRLDATDGWVDIATATMATYTLVTADRFTNVRVIFSFSDAMGNSETRTSPPYPEGGSTVNPIDNMDASGAPTISGTARVGEELEADPAGIMDANGTSGATFTYQWQRGEVGANPNWTDIGGASAATYTAVDADEGTVLRVVVTYMDDDRYRESRESEPTSAVQPAATGGTSPPPAEPTTPQLSIADPDSSVVEGNPGETATLEFVVSLEPAASTSVTVNFEHSGGSATPGANADFTLPASGTLTFPPNTTEQTIPVTVHGDFVSESEETIELTISSAAEGISIQRARATGRIQNRTNVPAVLRVVDAELEVGDEGQQSVVEFELRLDESLSYDVTVGYQIVLGETAGSGSLARHVGARACSASPVLGSATIRANSGSEVEVSEDIGVDCQPEGAIEIRIASVDAGQGIAPDIVARQDDGGALLAATISSGAEAEAEDWATTSMLTAFGRSVGTSLVDAVWNRAEAHRHGAAASFANLGGRSIDIDAFASDASTRRGVRETSRLLGIEAVDPAQASFAVTAGDSLVEGDIDDFRRWASLPDGDSVANRSSFSLALDEGGGSTLVYWGAGSLSNYSSELEDDRFSDQTLTSDGSTTTISLGLDYRLSESTLLGFAVSSISGSSEYELAESGGEKGDLSSSLTSVLPWFRWKSPGGMEVWGALGIGSGSADGKRGDEKVEMDLGSQVIALGAWNRVTSFGSSSIAAKGDFFTATVSSDGAGDEVDSTDAGSSRIRVAAEMSTRHLVSTSRQTSYALELGARQDSGEAESGFGVDAAAEFDYGGPRSSVKVTGRGGIVLFHGQEGFSETGFGLGITFDPGADGRGLQLVLNPTWNASLSPDDDAVRKISSSNNMNQPVSDGGAIEAGLDYGMSALGDSAHTTLYGRVRGEREKNRLRIGSELRGLGRHTRSIRLDVYGEMRNHTGRPERSVLLEGSVGF